MSTQKLTNIPLQSYRDFLTKAGCKRISTTGGHEKWVRKDFFNILFDVKHSDNPVGEGEKIAPVMEDTDLCFCGSGLMFGDCHGKKKEK